MSGERLSLDANILFYTVDSDAGALQATAREIVRQAARQYDCFLTLQTLCEFFASTTRKRKLSAAQAAASSPGSAGVLAGSSDFRVCFAREIGWSFG